MAEDRGIEEYGSLRSIAEKKEVYDHLVRFYRQADEKYNAGLFNFRDDQLTTRLILDDKVIAHILRNLYYPESPYQFSVLPSDVLGQVYEQFLGKVIRLTPSHRAVVEEKPEVKKAGGVFYTPSYIVDYIVLETLGKLLKGKNPEQITNLRILDPACGSGTFLLSAFQYLLDIHLEHYRKNEPEKHSGGRRPKIYKDARASWCLTTAEKKRILLNNIFGVDIDNQAVEVTKLSLLLKVLEGETDETLGQQLKLWRERALPDLGNNIRCGNSLIGTRYFDSEVTYTNEVLRKINPFDWDVEFNEIMNSGGFHAVIGNPPYVRMEGFKEIKEYLKKNFFSHDERSDKYVYFVERGINLLRRGGYFGMILSNKFLRTNYGRKLRQFIASYSRIERITDFAGLPVFPKATVRTLVLIATKYKRPHDNFVYSPPLPFEEFRLVKTGSKSVEYAIDPFGFNVPQKQLGEGIWSLIPPEEGNLLERLADENIRLEEYCENKIYMGIKSGLAKAFVLNSDERAKIIKKNPAAQEIIKPLLNGRDIRQFQINPPSLYLIYTYHGVPIEKYPAIREHLLQFKNKLIKRATKQAWYELQQPQYNYAKYLDSEKLVFPDMAISPRFSLDTSGHYLSNTVYFIPGADLYLLGLLNSFISNFYFTRICAALEGPGESYLRFFGQYLKGFPVRRIDPTDKEGMVLQRQVIDIVQQLLDLSEKQTHATLTSDIELFRRQIESLRNQLNQVVRYLYGLDDEELLIVNN